MSWSCVSDGSSSSFAANRYNNFPSLNGLPFARNRIVRVAVQCQTRFFSNSFNDHSSKLVEAKRKVIGRLTRYEFNRLLKLFIEQKKKNRVEVQNGNEEECSTHIITFYRQIEKKR